MSHQGLSCGLRTPHHYVCNSTSCGGGVWKVERRAEGKCRAKYRRGAGSRAVCRGLCLCDAVPEGGAFCVHQWGGVRDAHEGMHCSGAGFNHTPAPSSCSCGGKGITLAWCSRGQDTWCSDGRTMGDTWACYTVGECLCGLVACTSTATAPREYGPLGKWGLETG